MRLPIRWLLLGVAAASLLMPLLAFLSLRSFDAALVRQTERELNAQGALVAAQYQQIWSRAAGKPVGDPRDRWHTDDTYTPRSARIEDLSNLAAPIPDVLPRRSAPPPAQLQREAEELSRVLQNGQVFNLSAVRVLDEQGCTLASTRTLGECFAELPEVATALSGKAASALRPRVADEPPPAYGSLSRRGDLRVFVSLPVYNDSEVIGAVLLSRTAESGVEWLFKQRRDIFYGGLLVLFFAVVVSFTFSRWITRPLSQMKARLETADASDLGLRFVAAPREIHTLGVALDERASELAHKRRYIEEFAANVSHELKTPLTSIRGAVELLQYQGEAMTKEQRERFLHNIDAAAARTDRLVSRLLQLARLEAGHELAEEELVLVDAWLDGLEQRYADSLTIRRQGLGERRCNLAALEAVVHNLIDNALRHRRTLPVELAVAAHGSGLHLSVSDDGPGISSDNQRRLFERFFTTERDRGGTGLGLAIVLATARTRGGRVQVISSESGTRVEVWM